MDWKKVALNVLRGLNQYLNLSELSEDVQEEIVQLFEQLEESGTMPEVVVEIADAMGVDISDVVAVLVKRLLDIMESVNNQLIED